ncbi:glycosyltransferase family 2 protein [Patescibacteria group bacterium]
MQVSIIIPTYNEGRNLVDCVESLGNQTYSDFEIIVVDDGSTDETLKVLENLKKTIPNFKYFKQKHKGAGEARNLGVKHAKCMILAFVDADMTFDKDFIKNLVKPIKEGKVKGTFSRKEYVANWDNVWAKCWNINQGWQERMRHPANYPNKQKVFRAILRSEFEKVDGFDPGYGYVDDWSLSDKLGYQAEVANGAIFYHKNPESLEEVFKQARWVGKRPYKMGLLGAVYALLRASLLVSLIIGVYKSISHKTFLFLVFKPIYDMGVFIGILQYLLGKTSK